MQIGLASHAAQQEKQEKDSPEPYFDPNEWELEVGEPTQNCHGPVTGKLVTPAQKRKYMQERCAEQRSAREGAKVAH